MSQEENSSSLGDDTVDDIGERDAVQKMTLPAAQHDAGSTYQNFCLFSLFFSINHSAGLGTYKLAFGSTTRQ